MPQSAGPKLANKENLMFTYRPGGSTPFNNFTASLATDAAAPKKGAVQGPRRKNVELDVHDDRYDVDGNKTSTTTLSLQNINGSVYNLNPGNTSVYTLSLWVKVIQFPAKYVGTISQKRQSFPDGPGVAGLTTKSKRAALAKFDYSYSGNGNRHNGFIQFGAMAPYYKNANGIPNYKTIFSPISFGVAICGSRQQQSVYTDYKFNLNQWYLLTIQLQSDSNFATAKQNINIKMFVNNSQENIAKCDGIAWANNNGKIGNKNRTGGTAVRYQTTKRKNGSVAGQPGFYNCAGGGTIPNGSSQQHTYTTFMDLSRLNCISYSPILHFGAGIGSNQNSNGNLPVVYGNNKINAKGTSIDFGQTYIYDTTFNATLYNQFKGLYR
jgi:hypothetical protein